MHQAPRGLRKGAEEVGGRRPRECCSAGGGQRVFHDPGLRGNGRFLVRVGCRLRGLLLLRLLLVGLDERMERVARDGPVDPPLEVPLPQHRAEHLNVARKRHRRGAGEGVGGAGSKAAVVTGAALVRLVALAFASAAPLRTDGRGHGEGQLLGRMRGQRRERRGRRRALLVQRADDIAVGGEAWTTGERLKTGVDCGRAESFKLAVPGGGRPGGGAGGRAGGGRTSGGGHAGAGQGKRGKARAAGGSGTERVGRMLGGARGRELLARRHV